MRKKEEAEAQKTNLFFTEVEAGMRKQEKQQHEKIRALQASVAALQQDKAQVVRT